MPPADRADLRPCAYGSAVRTALVAWPGLNAARLAGPGGTDGQKDGRTGRGIA